MRPVETVLGRLEGVKRAADRAWMAKCPGHDDRQASLSVKEADDGRVLLNCHAGCDTSSVVENIELSMSDLFPDRDSRGNDVVARFDYQDEGGKLLYQVVRMFPKRFMQRQPDGRGGWKWNMEGARRVLYNLPRIAKAKPGSVVYVVEGEKDADNLERIGLLATTNVGGAGKWLPEYSSALKGKVVIVLPDNDQPGEAHAALVVKSLAGVAAATKVVQLPDLPPKGDVSNWLEAGGTREKLERLVEQAPGKVPQTFKAATSRLAGERAARLAEGKKILTFGVNFLDHAMCGIARGDVILYGAASGVGKTALASITAAANSQRGHRVHYLALEAKKREIERRAKYQVIARLYYAAGGKQPIRYQDWYYGLLDAVLGPFEDEADRILEESSMANMMTFYREESFTSDDFVTQFEALAGETDLVILDHFHYVDTDDRDEVRAAKRLAKAIYNGAERTGTPVIVVAHLRKGERMQRDPLVPSLEDFSGAKDIGNVATKAVVLAPAHNVFSPDSRSWGTFLAARKNRTDSTVCRYVALNMFDVRTNSYAENYRLGRIVDGEKRKEFKMLEPAEVPFWADQDGKGQKEMSW